VLKTSLNLQLLQSAYYRKISVHVATNGPDWQHATLHEVISEFLGYYRLTSDSEKPFSCKPTFYGLSHLKHEWKYCEMFN